MGYEAGRAGYGAGDQRVMPQNGNRPAYGGVQEVPYGEVREGFARGAGEGLYWIDFNFNMQKAIFVSTNEMHFLF